MDNNTNSNGIKYDPVTGQPITQELDVSQLPQQGVPPIQPILPQDNTVVNQQPIQPVMPEQPVQYQMPQQPVNPQMPQQPVQPVNPQQQMYAQPLNQQPQMYAQPLSQQPVGYVNPVPGGQYKYATPQPAEPDDANPEAKKLSLAAIICFAAAHILPSIFYRIVYPFSIESGNYSDYSTATGVIYGIGALIYIAAVVLMIITRVKYPKNKAGKILMIVMIVEIALAVIGMIIIVATCYFILDYYGCGMFMF